jgi:hypothetical protein
MDFNYTNLNSNLIKKEEGIAHEEPLSLRPPPSTFYLKTPLFYSQSTLCKALLGCLRTKPQLLPRPDTSNPSSLVMRDPITLRHFAAVRDEYATFAREGFPGHLYQDALAVKRMADIKNHHTQSSTNEFITTVTSVMKKEEALPHNSHVMAKKEENLMNNPVVKTKKEDNLINNHPIIPKKEEALDEREIRLSDEEEKTPLPQKPMPKKKAQNRIKNIPGLVVQRVRSSIKAYFTLNPNLGKAEGRLAYIERTLGYLSKLDRERLLSFLEHYQKNWKTWNTIHKYLKTNPKYGGILLDVVLEFFAENGKDDFNDWLISGKMGEKSKTAVQEMKLKIGDKFEKLLMKIEDEGYLELKAKFVKKEEAD